MVTQANPFCKPLITEHYYAIVVRHAGEIVNTDVVWASNDYQALRRARYIAGTLAQQVVHPNDYDRKLVTVDVLRKGENVAARVLFGEQPTNRS